MISIYRKYANNKTAFCKLDPDRFYCLNFQREFNKVTNEPIPRDVEQKGTSTKSPRNGLLIEQLSNRVIDVTNPCRNSLLFIVVVC